MSDFSDSAIESALLVSLIENASWYEDVDIEVGLSRGVFSCQYNRNVFDAFKTLLDKGLEPDMVLVKKELDCDDEDDTYDYLDFEDSLPSINHAKSYAEILNEYASKRLMLNSLNNAKSVLFENPNASSTELNGQVQQALNKGFVENSKKNTCVTVHSVIPKVLENMKEWAQSDGGITGARTGLRDLDLHTLGFQSATYNIIAGRPAMGKTTVAMQACLAEARNGGRVKIFSLEMPSEQLVLRLLANMARVDLSQLNSGKLTSTEMSRFNVAIEELEEIGDRLIIDDSNGLTAAEIRNRCLKEHRKAPLTMVMIDYFQLLSLKDITWVNGDTEKLGESSKILNDLKKELSAAILLLSQLSRKVEDRQDKRPVNSDLRSTGQLEQDADIIMMVYRDEVYNPETPMVDIIEIIITKFRNGSLATIYGKFEGAFNALSDLAHDVISDIKGMTSKVKTKFKKRNKKDEKLSSSKTASDAVNSEVLKAAGASDL